MAERRVVCDSLVAAVRNHVEAHAHRDEPGLEAIAVWTDALEHAAVTDLDLLQKLVYGLDALVRVHLWRETGMPLEPPEARPRGDVWRPDSDVACPRALPPCLGMPGACPGTVTTV